MKLTTFAIVATALVVCVAFANPIAIAADHAVASLALREIVTAFQAAAVTLWG